MNSNTRTADITATPVDEHGLCLCHDASVCPDDATIAVNAGELAAIADLLGTLDGFLRSNGAVATALADHLGGSRYDASLLLDRVGLAAIQARRVFRQHEHEHEQRDGDEGEVR